MSREIKFRAWNMRRKIYQEVGRLWFYFRSKTIGALERCSQEYTIGINQEGQEPEFIIEQFTGLKDKNGVEIYEGDILENVGDQFSDLKGETIFMVIYQGSGFVMKYKTGTFFMSSLTHLYKKIGNIHENPELLEG